MGSIESALRNDGGYAGGRRILCVCVFFSLVWEMPGNRLYLRLVCFIQLSPCVFAGHTGFYVRSIFVFPLCRRGANQSSMQCVREQDLGLHFLPFCVNCYVKSRIFNF